MAFDVTTEIDGATAKMRLMGELDAAGVPQFREAVEQVIEAHVHRLVLLMASLDYLSSAGLRVLIFAKQKLGAGSDIYIVGAPEHIVSTLAMTGFQSYVIIRNEDDPALEG